MKNKTQNRDEAYFIMRYESLENQLRKKSNFILSSILIGAIAFIMYFLYEFTLYSDIISEIRYFNFMSYIAPRGVLILIIAGILCFISTYGFIAFKKNLAESYLPVIYQQQRLYIERELAEREKSEKPKRQYELLSKRKKNKLFFFLYAVVASTITILIWSTCVWGASSKNLSAFDYGLGIVMTVFVGSMTYLTIYVITISVKDKAEYEMMQQKSESIKNEIGITPDSQNDFFTRLINLSNNYLDQYYYQTKIQAEKSFRVSLFISIFGAFVICFGIILLFADKTNPAYVTTAAGVLSEFIAAVFFYFYNNTIKSMSKYHNKLVLSQNISIALKVADTLPEEMQGELRSELIKQLVKDINQYIIAEEK